MMDQDTTVISDGTDSSIKSISYLMGRLSLKQAKHLPLGDFDICAEEVSSLIKRCNRNTDVNTNLFLLRLALETKRAPLVIAALNNISRDQRIPEPGNLNELVAEALKNISANSKSLYFLSQLTQVPCDPSNVLSLLETSKNLDELVGDLVHILKAFDASIILEFLQKISKKSTANTLELCSIFAKHGIHATAVLQVIKPTLLSENDENRERSVAIASHYPSDAAFTEAAFKESLLKNFKIKSSVLKVAQAWSSALPSDMLSSLLMPLLDKETNEETLGCIFSCLFNANVQLSSWIEKKIPAMKPTLRIVLLKASLYSSKDATHIESFKKIEPLMTEKSFSHLEVLLLTAVYLRHAGPSEDAKRLFKKYFGLSNGPFSTAHLETADPLATLHVLKHFYCDSTEAPSKEALLFMHSAYLKFSLHANPVRKDLEIASRKSLKFAKELLEFILKEKLAVSHKLQRFAYRQLQTAKSDNILLLSNFAVFREAVNSLHPEAVNIEEIIEKLQSAQCNQTSVVKWLSEIAPSRLFSVLLQSNFSYQQSIPALNCLKTQGFVPSSNCKVMSFLNSVDVKLSADVLYALLALFKLCLPFSYLLKTMELNEKIDPNWCICFSDQVMQESAKNAFVANGSAFALWLLMQLPFDSLDLTKSDCETIIGSIEIFDAMSLELAVKFAVYVFENHPILADSIVSALDKSAKCEANESLLAYVNKISLSEDAFARKIAHLVLRNLLNKPKSIQACELFLLAEFDESNPHVALEETLVVGHLKKTPSSAVEIYGRAISAQLDTDALERAYKKLVDARIPEGPKQRIKAGTDLTVNGRKALASVFKVKPVTDPKYVKSFFLDLAFTDPNEEVADVFLNRFVTMISDAPKAECTQMLCVFEESLQSASKDQSDRLGIFLMVGITALTRKVYFEETAEGIGKRNQLCQKLIERLLNAPSERVQKAIADAIVSILQIGRLEQYDCIPGFLEKCMAALGDGKAGIALRRGCAFGLAAICSVGGLRFLCIHQFVSQFTKWLAEGSSGQKIGALYAIELISFYLGPLFEPFAIQLAPFVMAGFSGGSGASGEELREASSDAAVQLITSSLSSIHGVKILLPKLLDELVNSSSRRTRVATIEWLGQMSAINRSSLAPYLPLIVPALAQNGLIDAHPQVQKAAKLALTQYGRSIRSPEIQKLFPRILEALSDPEKNLNATLEEILNTNFSHAVDGSSLALVAPLLTRALMASSELLNAAESKRKAANIIGNLGSLVDVRELRLLLKSFLDALLHSLGDANPSVRTVCAKVVGVLSSLVPNDPNILEFESLCLQLFKGERSVLGASNALFRSGAASAVAELLANRSDMAQAAAGVEYIMELFQTRTSPESSASSNVIATEMMALFAGFLPEAFVACDRLDQIYESAELKTSLLPLIMRDMVGGDGTVILENELIRASASQSAHKLVTAFSMIDPNGVFELIVDGIVDARWKVRLLSLELLADYVGQVFAVGSEEDEEGSGGLRVLSDCPPAEELKTLLPEDLVNRLIAAVFLARFDSHGQIKSMGFGFWRGIAGHPVRAVTESIPFLVPELCRCFDLTQSSELDLEEEEMSIESLTGMGDRAEAAFAVILEMCRRMLEKTVVPMAKTLLDTLLNSSEIPPFAPLGLVCFVLQALLTQAQQGAIGHSEKVVITAQLVPLVREILLFDMRDSDEILVSVHAFAFELLLEMVQVIGGNGEGLQSFVEEMVQGRKERFDVLLPLVRARPQLLVPILLKQIMQPNSLETIDIKDSKLRRLFLNSGDDLAPFVFDLIREYEETLSKCSVETVGLLFASLQEEEREFGRVMQHLLIKPRPLVFYLAFLPHLTYLEDDRMAIYRLIFQNNSCLTGPQVETLLAQAPESDFVNLAVMLNEHSQPQDEKALDVRVRKIIVPLLINRVTCAKGIPMIAALIQGCQLSLPTPLVIALMGALIRMTSEKDLGLGAELVSALTLLLQKYSAQAKPFYPQLQRVFVNTLDASSDDLAGLRLLLSVSPRPEVLLGDLCKFCVANPARALPVLQLMADWKQQQQTGAAVPYDFSSLKILSGSKCDSLVRLLLA